MFGRSREPQHPAHDAEDGWKIKTLNIPYGKRGEGKGGADGSDLLGTQGGKEAIRPSRA